MHQLNCWCMARRLCRGCHLLLRRRRRQQVEVQLQVDVALLQQLATVLVPRRPRGGDHALGRRRGRRAGGERPVAPHVPTERLPGREHRAA